MNENIQIDKNLYYNIMSYYSKIPIKRVNKVSTHTHVKKKFIIDFYDTLGITVIGNEDLEYANFSECLKEVYYLSQQIYVKRTNNFYIKIIRQAISFVLIEMFLDYLLEYKEYRKLANYYKICYKNDLLLKLKKNSKKRDREDINIYSFAYSNFIADMLYKDINKKEKIKYLIQLINNTNDLYFCNLNIIDSLGIINYNENRFKKSNTYILQTFSFSALAFALCIQGLILNQVQNTELNESYQIKLENMFKNEILVDDISLAEIDELSNSLRKLDYNLYNDVIDEIYNQYYDLEKVRKEIATLFIDLENMIVREDITLKQKSKVYELLINLPQQDFIKKNLKYFEMIDKWIFEQDIVELKEIVHISQKDSRVFNGCEAASLLMALQYKDKLLNVTLRDFVLEMPMSDDPHKGFVYDIYEYEPIDVAHWIAPDALASFGSNYGNVLDISGTSLETLKDYINHNNPIIVYVTAGYEPAIFDKQEVPVNLHVVLLAGYNEKKDEYIVYDPYYGKQNVSKNLFERSYNYLKYAVAVMD